MNTKKLLFVIAFLIAVVGLLYVLVWPEQYSQDELAPVGLTEVSHLSEVPNGILNRGTIAGMQPGDTGWFYAGWGAIGTNEWTDELCVNGTRDVRAVRMSDSWTKIERRGERWAIHASTLPAGWSVAQGSCDTWLPATLLIESLPKEG